MLDGKHPEGVRKRETERGAVLRAAWVLTRHAERVDLILRGVARRAGETGDREKRYACCEGQQDLHGALLVVWTRTRRASSEALTPRSHGAHASDSWAS